MTSPCPVELPPDRAEGGRAGWYCGHCQKNVHVLSNLTEREARALLAKNVGQDMCVTYAVRRDGTIRFRPEPEPRLVPAGALRRRRAATAAAVGLSAALAACTPHDNPEVERAPIVVEESSALPMSTPTIPEAHPTPEPDELLVDGEVAAEPVPPGGLKVAPVPEPVPEPEPEPLQLVDGGLWAEPPPPKPGGLKVEPVPEPSVAVPGGLTVPPIPGDDAPCDKGPSGGA